jgi:hypothetical protein
MVIWKYPLQGTRMEIEMPVGARLLAVQMQGTDPYLWALVNPENQRTRRRIAIYGAGHQMPADPGRYVGTFQVTLLLGDMVFHVFDQGDGP